MTIASTVCTLALTRPFSPMTSLPPTVISPPISHSTWIESAMSNLPSIRARSPTTVSSGTVETGLSFSSAFWLLNIESSLRFETARMSARLQLASSGVAPPHRGCQRLFRATPGGAYGPRGVFPLWRWPGPDRCGLEGANQSLDPLVVGLEGVLAEDRLALRIVELQVDPVDAIVLALQIRLADELAAEPRARGLRRHVLGLLDRVVVGDPVHVVVAHEAVVDALVGPDVVVLQVEERHLRVSPGEAVAVHEVVDELALDDPVELAAELHRVRLELGDDVGPAGEDVLGRRVGVDRVDVARRVLEVLELHLERRDRAAILQLDRLAQGWIVGDIADRLHRGLQ